MKYLTILFLTLTGTSLLAAPTFQSSRTMSLGQTGRGGALLNDTIMLNSSLMGFQQAIAVSGTFNWQNSAAPTSGNNLNISVIDAKNPYFNAGISYTRRPDLDFIHLGVAKKVTNWLSVGTSGKRFNTRSNSAAANGTSVVGLDAGTSLSISIPGVPIQLGFISDNIFHKAAHEAYVGPRQIGGGVKFNFSSILMIYGDFVENYSNFVKAWPSYHGAVELALGGDLFARAGAFGFREKGWSAGAGWVGPKIGLSYGYQTRRNTSTGDRSFDHAVTMDIFI